MENIKAIFLDLGGTFRIVEENEPFYHAARVRIAEICGTDMDPDAYYDFLNRRYDEYRKWRGVSDGVPGNSFPEP